MKLLQKVLKLLALLGPGLLQWYVA